MKYTFRLFPLLALLVLVASCSKAPDHAAYLPKDAQFVLSVNTGAMQKKLTWSFITGSDLLSDLRKSGSGEQLPAAMSDLQNSGLDFSSTLYFYTKADTRFEGSTRVNAVLPVASAAKVTDYIRKHIPDARISERGGRQVAIMDKACASWNDKVLILSNIAQHKERIETPARVDTLGGAEIPVEAYTTTQETPDTMLTLAELDSAFVKPAENLLSDKRFKLLEAENHDVSFWLSYDQLINGLRGRQEMSMMSGIMGGSFWEKSAMSAGLDFNNGEIVAKGKYFVSDSMRPIATEFAKENVDAGMLQRLPAGGLNFAMGYHLNPLALSMMLDKMGMSAMANMFLAEKGMTLDDILGAFTGDMVLAINNFRVESKMQEVDSMMREQYGITPYEVKKPAMDLVFAMKVKDQAKMQRLMGFVSQTGMLSSSAPNVWTLANSSDGSVLMQQNEYLVAGSAQPVAAAFLSANGGMPPAVKQEIAGHPYGMWADVNSLVAGAGPLAGGNPSDSMAYNAVKGVFSTFTANGGEFQNDASTFSMRLGFTNKQENSLLQLAQLLQRIAAANNARPVVMR